jgi:cell division protein FtsL
MNQPLHSRRSADLRGEPARRDTPGTGSPRHLVVVEDPISGLRSGALRTRLLLLGAAIGAVVIAFSLVYLHVVMAQRQFRLDKLAAQVTQDQATYSRLRLQVAQLESPQQIIATAEGRLGMRQPANVTYLSPSTPLPAGGAATGPAGGSTGAATNGTVAAPTGDADWPLIKSQLAGSP